MCHSTTSTSIPSHPPSCCSAGGFSCVRCGGALPPIGRAASVRRERPFFVLIALISALDSAVLRQRHFVKTENALITVPKEKPATADLVDNGNPDKTQGAEKEGLNPDDPKKHEKEGTEANSKKPEIRGAKALAQKGTAPLLLKHEMDELIKGETNTRNKRQSGGSARGDNVEKMPNKFDLTLPKYDPSESAAKASKYDPKFDRNNTPVDYDGKEKKCKVEAKIDVMSEELMKILKENGADQRDINAAEDGCGLKGYAEWSRCSKVAFYGRDGYNASKKYGIEKTEPPTKNFNDMDEFDKFGFMHDTVLMLFDGCAVCNGNKVPNVTISLLQYMPTGLLVDECKEFVNRSGKPLKLQMKMVKNQKEQSKRSFAYGVSLKERLCVEKKPNTDKAEYFMQKLEYKYRVVLEVNHTCNDDGEHKTHYIWLPEIDVFDKETVVGRVMQIRNLKLNLTEMDDNIDFTLILSESDFDKSGQFVNGTLIPYKAESVPRPIPAPKASNIDHLGINCTQIEFADQMPQFWLNMSVEPFFITCVQFWVPFTSETMHIKSPTGDDMFDACQKVPTSSNCDKKDELIVCYKTKSQTAVVNKEIAKICQEHLKIGHQKAHGFRIRLCTHREAEKQRIIVESVLDFSFTDEIHKSNKGFSYKVKAMIETMERTELFFIKFGNHMQQSVALRDGKEISAQLSKTIGTILPSIANGGGGAQQHRTKQLHFVPPIGDFRIFFQTDSPIFTRWITRRTNLRPFEHDPNKVAPDRCDLLGDDCEPTREILLQIQDVLQCCSPLNPYKQCLCDGSTNTVDISEFAAPPGEKVPAPPNTTPSSSSNSRWAHLGDPLEAGDIMYTKKQAQEKYDHIMEKCSKCVGSTPATEKATKIRSKRQADAGIRMIKWTHFPINIRMDPARIPKAVFDGRKEALEQAIELIAKDTCITFKLMLNVSEYEDIIVYDDGKKSSSFVGQLGQWQELSLHSDGSGTAGHELLHALGLKHEQKRDDALQFIKFNPEDRAKEWKDGFEPVEYTNNYDFAYDYGSVMHYWARVNPDGYYNMISMSRFYQRTFGKMEKPSFKDLAIINHIYCKDKCKGKKNECQNGGYPNPKQCNECFCPEGYGGAHCEQLEKDKNCVDLSVTPNNLEADWQIRELNPEVYCESAEMCSCHWRIKPKKGEKVIIKLNKLNEGALSCGGRCGTNHVEIKYRKDKRAQGALLCCASDIFEGNTPRNWIEAEEKDVDIIISARIATTDATELFGLTYETDGAKLLPSCACTDPHLLFDKKRSPGFVCKPPCNIGSSCKTMFPKCQHGFVAINDKVVQNETGRPVKVSCHKREGSAESFWYYWKQKDIEPIRIEEVHCMECHPKRDKGCKKDL
ncbi:hypothetical protein niasHT_003623 [Heterodera trifolii]|uniref:Metalloendopeptidase n=1 Tax=Heterodera trifolii TaxID=157864 RepID=A0ABD2MF03_9BILA